MKAIAERIAADHDVGVEVHGSFNRPPKPIDDGAAALFETVRCAGADLGLTIGWRATGGVCDGNNIAAAGCPSSTPWACEAARSTRPRNIC